MLLDVPEEYILKSGSGGNVGFGKLEELPLTSMESWIFSPTPTCFLSTEAVNELISSANEMLTTIMSMRNVMIACFMIDVSVEIFAILPVFLHRLL
jgi:hypothetical protein